MNENQNSGEYRRFLQEHCHETIATVEEEFPERYAVPIDWEDLAEFDLGLAREFLDEPGEHVGTLGDVLRDYNHDGVDLYRATMRDSRRIEPAVHNLPDEHSFGVGEYRHTEIGEYIQIEGQVTKRTEVNPLISRLCKVCKVCGNEEYQDISPTGKKSHLGECLHCEERDWVTSFEKSEWTDHQLVRVQTPPEEATDGNENILVHLTGPLTNRVESGDRVEICGEFRPGMTDDFPIFPDKYLLGWAVNVEDASFEDVDVTDDDVEEIERIAALDEDELFRRLTQSIAAAHKGDQHLKEAAVLVLFADFSRTGPDGAHYRGRSHMLFIGDPGAGKTLLLEGAASASPRSAFTDGMNSTSAGLTASMVRDDDFGDSDGWSIQAGTIVRANKGIAVIDELDKAEEDDLDSLHTALESEKVPVSKAGKSAILPAETSLIAAGNPTGGHFDPDLPFEDQIELRSPLLSRFDLIFAVREKTDEETVREIAQHMARARDASGYYAREDLDLTEEQRGLIEPEIPHETLRRYIAYATRNYSPVAESQEVLDRIADEFTEMKMSLPDRYSTNDDGDNQRTALPLTARAQQAIQRLAAASARVRLSDTYNDADVDRAIRLVRRSLRDVGILDGPTASSTGSSSHLQMDDVGIGDD